MARPRQISDQDILVEVRRAALESGPRFSLDLVAERLGVTAPALFKRFGNRNTLLIGALKPSRPPFLDELEAGPDERPLRPQLTELFQKLGTWLQTSVPCMMALKESGVPAAELEAAFEDAPPVLIVRTMARWLERAHGRHLARVVEPEATAMAMLGALQTRAFLQHMLRKTSLPRDLVQDAKRLCTLFCDGIAPRAAPATTKPKPRSRAR